MAVLEVCIDTVAGLAACVAGGADRIELCSALALGGLTPSIGLIKAAAACPIPVHAMIRPTPGAFDVTADTIAQMCDDIVAVRDAGLAGIVVGVTQDGMLDLHALRTLALAADGMALTLHRAIDLIEDPLLAIDQVVDLGFARVLTSGGAMAAVNGADQIRRMREHADGRVTIMAGSGVTPQNVATLITQTGVSDVHASCASTRPNSARIVDMGFGPVAARFTDATQIKAMRAALQYTTN